MGSNSWTMLRHNGQSKPLEACARARWTTRPQWADGHVPCAPLAGAWCGHTGCTADASMAASARLVSCPDTPRMVFPYRWPAWARPGNVGLMCSGAGRKCATSVIIWRFVQRCSTVGVPCNAYAIVRTLTLLPPHWDCIVNVSAHNIVHFRMHSLDCRVPCTSPHPDARLCMYTNCHPGFVMLYR